MSRQALPVMLLVLGLLLAQSARADTLSLSYSDPIGDQSLSTFIDVSSAVLTFDQCNGDYRIDSTAAAANPFNGAFRINLFLFNGDRGPAQDPSFFIDNLNDFDLMSPTTLISLTGTNPRLTAWRSGDRVATNTTGLLGNPDGIGSFASSVSSIPFSASDSIAQDAVETVMLQAAQACTPPDVSVTKTDQLVADSDGVAGPGDRLKYTVVITNSGGVEASGATYSAPAVGSATLAAGSVSTSMGTVATGNLLGNTTVSVDIGSIAASGGSVTIMYELVIDDPLPAGILQISCQGTVSGDNFSDALSDDPETPVANDPTVTPIGLLASLPVQDVPALSRPGQLVLLLLLAAFGVRRLFSSS